MEKRHQEMKDSCFCLISSLLSFLFVTTHGADLSYSVLEELKAGTVVGNITKDLGIDVQAIRERNLRVVSDRGSGHFDLDSSSGAIVVSRLIDRERHCGSSSACLLRMKVLLNDPAEVHRVAVEVVDVNDNAPRFPAANTTLEVSEAAAPGTRFRLEGARDVDVGVNALRSYDLTPNDNFLLNVESRSDGSRFPVLLLDKPLDRERQGVFRLVLTATDGGKPQKSGTTVILMNVLDVNDNAPVFEPPAKRVRLLENSTPGTLVTQLNASDADHGPNGEVSYAFDKYTPEDVLQLFRLNAATGDIHVTGVLDRERASVFDVTVLARDRGAPPMEGSCSIKVEIVDVNDNTPAVHINSLSGVLREDVEPGTVVAIIGVRDEDVGDNGAVHVRVSSGLPFKLSPPFEEHYTLMTDGPLDRETVAEYTISVTATDSGSPPRSSQESFVLRLSDVNDNSPVFSQPSYSVEIVENNVPNAPLLTVSASDPDLGENGSLSFSILESEVSGFPVSSYVYINAKSGLVYALRSLDHEQISAFQIHVQVQDSGSPSRSANVTVHVFVLDENDHAPAPLYPTLPRDGPLQLTVPRSAAVGQLLQRIICLDGDSGHNAWLFYSLSGPDASHFRIGPHTGELRTARKLAQEEIGVVFSIIVMVQDNGMPSLSSSVAVNITVVEKAAAVSSQRRSNKRTHDSDVTLYLVLSLSAISVVSFLMFLMLAFRWLRRRGRLPCFGHTYFSKHTLHHPRHHPDLHLQLNTDGPISYMEVVGNSQDPHKHTIQPCFSTLSSRSDFVFVKKPIVKQSPIGLKLFTHLNKQKPPSNDWRLPPNQRPGPSGQYRFHTIQQRWTPYEKSRAVAHPEGAPAVTGTGPWPNPPTEAEQLQALMAAANEVSEATATLGPRYNAQYVPDYRQNVYIPGSTATLTTNPQQPPQQALPPPQALPPADAPKAAQTPASKKKSAKKDKK